jgi:hypothetical protein
VNRHINLHNAPKAPWRGGDKAFGRCGEVCLTANLKGGGHRRPAAEEEVMYPLTTAEDDPDREHESQAEAPAPAAETPTRLRQAAAGMVEAQAWKGQQIAKGWRKLVNALRRREEGEGTDDQTW